MMIHRGSVHRMKLVVKIAHCTTSMNRWIVVVIDEGLPPIVSTPPRLGIERGGQKNRAIDELRTLFAAANKLKSHKHLASAHPKRTRKDTN
jgi:hypothetical protein